jgi:CBS domain containing-hemolysin-like protein
LVAGEQFPKIFAIRRPEVMLLWCAPLLRVFYALLLPFLTVLNGITTFLLHFVGIRGTESDEGPNSQEEIQALLREAHIHGNLTRNEHSLINNVFEFDDLIVRRVMLPRGEVAFIDINESLPNIFKLVKLTKHTRYPVCDRSLDRVLGVVHIKDMIGLVPDATKFDVQKIMRPPKKVPESMPISLVLRHFQATHQLMAFVVDEYGTITGLVTLENVLERIVGEVDDEFDVAKPNVVPHGPGEFIVNGTTRIEEAEAKMNLTLNETEDADTISGLLIEMNHGFLAAGDEIVLDGAIAQVLEVKQDRAIKVRFRITEPANGEAPRQRDETESYDDLDE